METMETSRLQDLVLAYEDARSAAEELEAQAKEAKAKRDAAEAAVINAILSVAEETGIDDLSVSVEGRKYAVKVKEYYSIPKPNRDEAFQLLRELGHGDLITERVDDRTLSSEMATVREEYLAEHPDGNENYPAEYEPLVAIMNTYQKATLSRVKTR